MGASGYENLIYLRDKQYLIGTSDGYLIINLSKIKEPKDFNVSINKILNNRTDEFKKKVSLNGKSIFDVTQKNIEFHYSVSNYNKTSSIKYQYILEGVNEKWSRLYDNNSVLYENLPLLYIKDLGHQIKNGDKITVEKATDLYGINNEEINTEHLAFVGKVYRIHTRIISPLPEIQFFNMLYLNLNND